MAAIIYYRVTSTAVTSGESVWSYGETGHLPCAYTCPSAPWWSVNWFYASPVS